MKRKSVLISIIILILAIVLTILLISNQSPEVEGTDYYLSCGCGCCGFDEPLIDIAKEKCLPIGKTFQDMKNNDKKIIGCETMGCSFPIKYAEC